VGGVGGGRSDGVELVGHAEIVASGQLADDSGRVGGRGRGEGDDTAEEDPRPGIGEEQGERPGPGSGRSRVNAPTRSLASRKTST
jgi:hypothetical protein